ncbi:MAG: molybdopterin-dependent oxidoreductase, partial [Deltaproteobacteria bacterium]|nr:molybdopterin-dependent oxidoreductase [Nannocystaceae bacterium]
CSLCEAMCGLTLTVEDNRVTAVRGDDDDPLSRGYMCPKGPAIAALHEDPERLREPMRRTASGWQTIGWDEALGEAASRLHGVQREHGKHAVAFYLGNPTVHNLGSMLYAPQLLRALGSRHRYSATSVDQLPQMLASYLMYGHQLLLPVPDVDRTQHMIIVGANPLVSNGSIMSAPDMRRRLHDIRARGGKVVVLDPRRTETAAVADEHVFVRPGSDALLLLAMAHVLFEERLVRLGRLESMVRNLEGLRAAVEEFAPERVAEATGVDAPSLRRLTRELAASPAGVVYGRVGVSMHPFGGVCHWLVNALNVLTGNLDRVGGSMFARPAFDVVGAAGPLGVGKGSFGRWRSKVRGLPEFGGELPVATLAEDIAAGGDDAIRGLITLAGNPVLSTPNGARLEQAIAGLDFVLAIDFYLNETTRHAHLILPPSGPLEHAHFDVALHAIAVRNTVKYSPAIFATGDDQRHDHEILAGLERRLHALRKAPLLTRTEARAREQLGPDGILALGLRAGPWGYGGGLRQGWGGMSLSKLKAAPHGIDLGALNPCLPDRLPARRGGVAAHIDLAPQPFVDDIARCHAELHGQRDAWVLIGRRQLRSNNSWMHNVAKLMTGKPRCTLLVHPDDAARLGITDGQAVRVSSRVGSVVAPAELDDGIMPGVVSLPHGFGHHRPGTRQGIAAAHAGVSINDVTDDARVDALSGVAAFSGVPVLLAAVTE